MTESAQGLDLVRVPAATLGALHRVLNDQLGPTEAARALRQIGLESGTAFFERFREWLSESGAGNVEPESLSPHDFWARLGDFFSHLGWGTVRSEVVHRGVLSLTFTNWVEARVLEGGPGGCHFTTGLFAEILRHVVGGDLAALEVEVDPAQGKTRVVIGSSGAMDALFASMREGRGYKEAIAALA